MIKNSKIKESIFCYWCAIYEEELAKAKELDNMDFIINKVAISELEKSKYQKSIFLTIEDNKTPILETGTKVNFIDIMNYVNDFKNKMSDLKKLYKYFEEKNDDVLLVGVKYNK